VKKLVFWSAFVAPFVVLACGARTGLYVPYHRDAGPDVEREAEPDVAEEDALPEFPLLDATKHDVDKTGCPPLTYVWAVSDDDYLLRFDPPTATFTRIAKIVCPANGSHPFSMAVDRSSLAFGEYENGMLFEVSTVDGSCMSTPFLANQQPPFANFGMAYVTIGTGPAEQLFIAAESPATLGMITTPTFKVAPVAQIQPSIGFAELTGTGDGRLYAYYAFGPSEGSFVAELDKDTGQVLGQDPLPIVDRGTGWAFAFWGGDFWIFTDPGPQNTWHYDPATKTATIVAHYSAAVVGAGVSTCAPQ
jgi:hypothetical protein